jgi:hypothetical protein
MNLQGLGRMGDFGYIQCNCWRVSKSGEIAMRVTAAREGRHISGPALTSDCVPLRVPNEAETQTTKRQNERGAYARAREEAGNEPQHPTEPNQGEQDAARCSEDVRNAVGMRNKAAQIIRRIFEGGRKRSGYRRAD